MIAQAAAFRGSGGNVTNGSFLEISSSRILTTAITFRNVNEYPYMRNGFLALKNKFDISARKIIMSENILFRRDCSSL